MITVAICDDEVVFARKIKKLVTEYFYSPEEGCGADVTIYTDTTTFLKHDVETFDIVFLDIRMGKNNGIAAAQALREQNKIAVLIFVSGYVEYAHYCHEVQALQYMLKSEIDFAFKGCMDEAVNQLNTRNKAITIPQETGDIKMPIYNILYFESMDHFITACVQDCDTDKYIFAGKISDLESELLDFGFLRIHKSYLANMNYITSISNRVALLQNGVRLNCSRQNYEEILRRYIEWDGQK